MFASGWNAHFERWSSSFLVNDHAVHCRVHVQEMLSVLCLMYLRAPEFQQPNDSKPEILDYRILVNMLLLVS